jgi:hypothetical protein
LARRINAAEIEALTSAITFAAGQARDAAGWHRAEVVGSARQTHFAAHAEAAAAGEAFFAAGAAHAVSAA